MVASSIIPCTSVRRRKWSPRIFSFSFLRKAPTKKKGLPRILGIISTKDLGNRSSLRQILELVTRLVTKMRVASVWSPGLIWDTLPKQKWFKHPHLKQKKKLHQTTRIAAQNHGHFYLQGDSATQKGPLFRAHLSISFWGPWIFTPEQQKKQIYELLLAILAVYKRMKRLSGLAWRCRGYWKTDSAE